VPRPPKRPLTDNGRLLAHITNAALRHDTRVRHPFAVATEPHGTVQASIHRDMALADVVPSEELRSFLLRLYSARGTQDFEPSRLGDRLIRSGAIVANDGLISRRRRLGGMLRFYYREAAIVIARIVGQNAFQSQSQRFIAIT
jgi:hypothetical protein